LATVDSSEWVSKSPLPTKQPLIWYKVIDYTPTKTLDRFSKIFL